MHPAEYVADLITAYSAGKENIEKALKQATYERHRLIGHGDDNATLSWWELRRRKKAIQKIQNDEEIEKELCRLCNVDTIEKL